MYETFRLNQNFPGPGNLCENRSNFTTAYSNEKLRKKKKNPECFYQKSFLVVLDIYLARQPRTFRKSFDCFQGSTYLILFKSH